MVLERQEKQSAQMERLEAKVDELVKKVDRIEQVLIPGCGLPAKPKEAKPTRQFVDYIRVPAKAEVLAKLHEWIDGRHKVKALVYIQAAFEARILEKPPYSAASVEFPGRLGSKSLYYAYVGDETAFTDLDDQETIAIAIKRLSDLAQSK